MEAFATLSNSFDNSNETIHKLQNLDESNRFEEELALLKKYIKTINKHQRQRKLKHYDSDYATYKNIYNDALLHYQVIVSYLEKFDYDNATHSELRELKKDIHAHLDDLLELIKILKQTDEAYNYPDIDFWDRISFMIDNSFVPPQEKAKEEARKKTAVEKGFDYFFASLGIVTIAFVIIFPCYFAYTVHRDNANSYKGTGENSIFYNMTSTSDDSFEVPYSDYIVYLGDEGFPVELGDTTVQDLADYGYEFNYDEYDNEFDVGEDHYIVHHNNFYYNYNDASNHGYGRILLEDDDNYSTTIVFLSPQDCEAEELDWNECYITGVEIQYRQGLCENVFEFEDFDENTTYNQFLQYYDEGHNISQIVSDDDKDGVTDSESMTFDLDDGETQFHVYHSPHSGDGSIDFYILSIQTY